MPRLEATCTAAVHSLTVVWDDYDPYRDAASKILEQGVTVWLSHAPDTDVESPMRTNPCERNISVVGPSLLSEQVMWSAFAAMHHVTFD